MACNIEAVKELISDLSKNTNAKLVPVVASLEAALKDMELMKTLKRKTGGATTVDKAGITAEMYALGQEIQDLYTNAEYAEGTELAQIVRDIAKVTKQMDKLKAKLGLEGSVGDRILSNEPARRFVKKEATEDEIIKLSDYFEAKAVGNNLNISEELFGEDFDMLKENVEVNPGEETYFEGAKTQTNDMIDAVNIMVKEQFDHSTIAKIDVEEKTTVNRFQSISRLLLLGKPKGTDYNIQAGKASKDGYTLPKEVVTAVALASNDWLVTEAALRADRRTDDDTKRLLSKAPGEDLSIEEKERVSDVDGFVSNAATSIGGIVYKNLGLKVKPKEGENRELLEGKLKTELGLIALAAMENDGRITITKKAGEEIFGKGNDTTNGKGVNVFQYTPEGSLLVDDRTKLFAPNSRFANKIVGTETNMRAPKFEAPKAPRKVKTSSEAGEFFTVAQESQDAVNAQEAQSWEFDTDFIDSYRDMIKDEAGRTKLKALLGYKNPADSHLELRAGINGKNAQIESNMQYLEELYNQMEVEEQPKMWFPWKFVKNGRFILDTNTFNPQGKKLHRFAVFANEAIVTKKNSDMQMLALAMAFGADVDKRSMKTSRKTWADIQAKLDEMLDAGKSDLDILTAFNDGVEVFDHKDGVDTTTTVHPHDIEHAMGGLAEYRRYRAHVKANGTHLGMKSRLPLETDAITSGYILKTLQLPLLGYRKLKNKITEALGALRKGGVFTPESEFQNYGEQSESEGYDDAYNTPAKVMKGLIKPIQDNLLSNNSGDAEYEAANRTATELALGLDVGAELTAISRSFMKAPFMTFNYGSGLTNIVNSIGDAAIENLYKMMADPKKADQVQDILDSAIRSSVYDTESKSWVASATGMGEVQAFAKKFAAMTPKQRLEVKLPDIVANNIKSNISAGVGVALEQTFKETYGVYIDAGNSINASFTTMFRLFKAKVDIAIDAKQLELGKDGKRRHLTTAETNEVIKSMAASLPAIQTALANEDKLAKVMIYKTESTFFDSLDGEVVDNGQGRLKLDKGELSAQSKTYQLIEAASSGAVVPIHYLDGSIQTIVANSGVAALGVHDAWMFNIDEAMEGTRTYNEGTARVSSEYSLTEAVISGLNESINNATAAEIAMVDAQYKEEHTGKPDEEPTVNSIHTEMDNLYFEAEAAREQLFNNDLRFEHAALEGSSHVRPAGYTKIPRSVELNGEKGSIAGKASDPKVEPKKTTPKPVKDVTPQDTNATNIYFGTNENAGLSNFAIRPFTFDGEDYQSVEQAFQMEKLGYIDMPHEDYIRDGAYGANERIETDMAKETNGAKLKALGQSVREFDNEAWDNDVEAIMAKFIKASFEQNPAALKELLATGDTVLTHTQDKGKWGKLFPKILMDVRAELSTEPVVEEAPKTGFDPKGTVPFGQKGGKDYIKAQNANAFIGYPVANVNSSTIKYLAAAKDQGIPTNEDIKPTAETVAFVSVNGKGRLSDANFEKTVYEIARVLDADGIVLMDNDTIANGSWNATGEGRVQKELLEMGYEKNLVEIVDGDTKTRVNQFSKEGIVKRDKTVTPETATATATGLRWLNSKDNVIIDKLGNPKVTITSTKDLAALSKDYDTLLRERGLIEQGTERADTELVADIFADLDNAIFGDTKVTVKFNQHMGKDNVMGYATGKDIQMSTGAVFTVDPMKVVLHEFAHTITSDQLKKNPVIDKRVTAMRERAIALGLDKNPLTSYAVTNNAEFLAEAISNPYFQASLRAMKTDGKSTLLAQVKTVFKNLLKRAKADGSLDNALGDVLDVVIDLQPGTATVNGETTAASAEQAPWDESPVEVEDTVQAELDAVAEEIKALKADYKGMSISDQRFGVYMEKLHVLHKKEDAIEDNAVEAKAADVTATMKDVEAALKAESFPEAMNCSGGACYATAAHMVKVLENLGVITATHSTAAVQNMTDGTTRKGDHKVAVFALDGKVYQADIPQSTYMTYDNKGGITINDGMTADKLKVVISPVNESVTYGNPGAATRYMMKLQEGQVFTDEDTAPFDPDPVVEPVKPKTKKPNATGTYELFPGVQTNKGQTAAINDIKEWYKTRETSFLVKGRGGTGKTTIVNKVLEELGLRRDQVMFATPTNKAKVVISIANKDSKYGGSEYVTTAGLLNYGEDTAKSNSDGTVSFIKKTFKVTPVEDKLSGVKVLVIDEASMLNSVIKRELEAELIKAGTKVIYMGDNVQLPPVKDIVDGYPLSESSVFAEHADGNIAVLDERMRQGAESPILPVTDDLAHSIENGTELNLDMSKAKDGSELENDTTNETLRVEKFMEAYKADPTGARWIWYNKATNKNSVRIVQRIRAELFGEEALDKPFVNSEQVYVADGFAHESRGKKQKIYNGMEAEVSKVNYKGLLSTEYGNRTIGKHRVTLPVIYATLKDNLTGELFQDVPIFSEATQAKIKELQAEKPEHARSMGALYSVSLKNVSFAGVINAHKAQGSTYNTVFVDVGNIVDQKAVDTDSKLKALYVATSRPKKKLVMMNVPTGKPATKPTPTKVPKATSTQPVVGDNTTSPAILKMIRSIGNVTNMPVRAKLITQNKVKFASNPEVMAMLNDMEADQGNAYVSPLQSKENPAIITDNIQSPKAQELGIDIEKAVAAEYKHAENSFKKCNK